MVTGGSLVRITNDPNMEARPRWSPDGTRIAYSRLNEWGLVDVWIVPALGGAPRRILTNAADAAWSPDGRTLCYANLSNNTIWLASSDGSNRRPVTQPERGSTLFQRQPAFSRDGQRVAFVLRRSGPYGELAVADVNGGPLQQLTDDGASVLSPVWSPDDKFIYFSSSRGGTMNIWRVSARGGDPEQITAGQGADAELDLSADGQCIVFSNYRMNTNIAELRLDTEARQAPLIWLTTDSARGEAGPSYSPDGTRIAYFSNRIGSENEGIWLMDADGSNPHQLVDDDRINGFPRWSPDGRSLYFVSRPGGRGARRLWAKREIRRIAVSGGLPEALPIETSEPAFGDVSRDGRLVFRSPNGEVQIFDPSTNRTETLPGVRGNILRWSPDGRHLAYLVAPREEDDSEAGLWIRNLDGPPRQLFRGWLIWYAWVNSGELLVVEGKPELQGVLWRVRSAGSPPIRALAAPVPLYYYYWASPGPAIRWFDVHPDGRRIIGSFLETREADIGIIENLR